ncbi:MAG: heme lyase CcmF/NrfE family subunit [Hyphomicrobiales bacterium]
MTVELGHYALILALALAFVQMTVPLWGSLARDPALMRVGRMVAWASFGFVAFSYAALTMAYVNSDFSVFNVVMNSHSAKPLIYKISGVWSNHEGSMMLWVLILVLFAALVAWRGGGMPERLLASVLSVQGAIAFAFILFVVVTSNPFERVFPIPVEGQGLNPVLQDPGLAIHPPLLYLGYVGFSIAYSFAVGALIHGRIDAVFARFVRPWTLLAWLFLTLGISMGSYWAYYELGWGGWWFWDPVENASLMPWLMGTALVHCTVVMEKRDALKVWTILLAILTFSLSLLGAFIVRSGVLTSVHSFASDPTRGVFILGILTFFVGGGLALFAWRAPMLRQGGLFAAVSREGALIVNNLFLAATCAAVLIGTLYPLALEAISGGMISVGPPFFNATAVPLFVILLALLPIGQTLAWKRGNLLGAAQRMMAALGLSILVSLVMLTVVHGGPVAAPLGVGLGTWLILGSVSEIVARSWRRGATFRGLLARAFGLPRAAWGAALAHAGIGVTVIGVAATGWGVENLGVLKPGERIEIGAYSLVLEKSFVRNGQGFREDVARFSVMENGGFVGAVETGKRVHAGRDTPTTEAGILTLGLGQVYASVNDFHADGSVSLKAYWKPLVLLIWLGSVLMATGGGLALIDRRSRIGIVVRSKAAALLAGRPA